jgi:hypothetical protein
MSSVISIEKQRQLKIMAMAKANHHRNIENGNINGVSKASIIICENNGNKENSRKYLFKLAAWLAQSFLKQPG